MFILPSIFKNEVPISRLRLSDWYLIFVIYLMPTSFLAFLPNSWLYIPGVIDHRLLSFLFSVPLLFIGPRRTSRHFRQIPGVLALCLVAVMVVCQSFCSFGRGIPFSEVISVLRWNFIWVIFSICILHYVSRLPKNRIYGILRIFIMLFCLHLILVFISLFTGIDFFLNKNDLEKSLQYINMGIPVDNLRAFPSHLFIGTALLSIACTSSKRLRTYFTFLAMALALPLLYTRRMYTIVLFFQIFLIYVLSFFQTKKLQKLTIYFIVISCFLLFYYYISPSRIDRLISKIVPAISESSPSMVSLDKVGTYSFRLRLLEDAKLTVEANNSQIFGMGYRREDTKLRGEYSYVLGQDSFIAPVIFCEGYGGLFLRILPYFFLFIHNVRRIFRVNDRNLKIFSGMVVGVIVAQIPSYLQSSLICQYDYFYVPIAFVELIIIKTFSAKGAEVDVKACVVNGTIKS